MSCKSMETAKFYATGSLILLSHWKPKQTVKAGVYTVISERKKKKTYLLQYLELLTGIPLHLLDGIGLSIYGPLKHRSFNQAIFTEPVSSFFQFINLKDPVLIQAI